MKKIDKRNIEDILGLTPMQEGMLFHYLKNPGSDYYFEQLSLEISGEIDGELFDKAWNFVVETNEMLRTVFRLEKIENPIQLVLNQLKLHPKYYDFSGNEVREREKRLEQVKTNDKKQKFDLRDVPFRISLCKLEKAKYEMIISNHHIIYDGWSNGIILKEFFKAYNDLTNGKKLLRPVKTRFREFVKWNQEQHTDEQEKFWRNHLKGFDSQTELSIKRRNTTETMGTGKFQIKFENNLKNKLEDFVKVRKITLASLLYSSWGLLLNRYNNNDDVIFGTVVSGRTAKIKRIEEMVGLFINTIPLRIKTNTTDKIEVLLDRVHNTLQVREKYESTPLVDIKKYSQLDHIKELFDSIVIIENYPLDSRLYPEDSKITIQSHSMWEVTNYDVTVGIYTDGPIIVEVIYDNEVFAGETIKRLVYHYRNMLENMVKHPTRAPHQIDMLLDEEKHQLLKIFNDTATWFPGVVTIHQVFETQVEKSPSQIAAVFNHSHLTYQALNREANRWGQWLRKKGVKPDTIVAIMVERSLEMIIAVMAVQKAGGAYLPVDPSYPASRINYLLKNSSALLLLTQTHLKNRDRIDFTREIISIDDFSCPSLNPGNPDVINRPGDLAYVIYTSGSTGTPKGVMVEHNHYINAAFTWRKEYRLAEMEINLLQMASFSFDVFSGDIARTFFNGGKLVICPGEKRANLPQLYTLIRQQCITLFEATPALVIPLMDYVYENRWEIDNLQLLIIGSDNFRVEDFKRLLLRFGCQMRIINSYGVTETTIDSSYFEEPVENLPSTGDVPIGKPLCNVGFYILDTYNRLQPIGIPGELCICGAGVSRGYLNHPEKTAEKFIPDFWYFKAAGDQKEVTDKTTLPRLYKSGDLACWLSDGNMQFLGRMDHQVKIRGYRIEPGEIENRLLTHEKVKKTVVFAREDGEGNYQYLCAYIVPTKNGTFESSSAMVSELKSYLSQSLPDYMIPSYFLELEEIPLTPNGKIDRKRLPAPVKKDAAQYTAPRDQIEKRLVEIWSGILNIETNHIGINTNFFLLGGHSLKATIMTIRIHKAFNVKLPLAEVFNTPTIRELAEYIRGTGTVLDRYAAIEPVEKKVYYALSSAQKRLYFLHQMEESEIAYNIPSIWLLTGDVNKARMVETFKKLAQRHDSLRTSFGMVGEELVQRIHDQVLFEIEYCDHYRTQVEVQVEEEALPFGHILDAIGGRSLKSQELRFKSYIHSFSRPFDLSQAPLFRVGVTEMEEEKLLLMVDIHHIISDGISTELLVQDFMSLYSGEELPVMRLRYKDFSEWQSREPQKETQIQQKAYWKKQLQGEIPVLDLPSDYTRPTIQRFAGSTVTFAIDQEEVKAVQSLALAEGVTPYMILLGIYYIFLSKLSNQEDILVGTPAAGRRHEDLQQIIGMFVNTLVLRNYPSGDKTYRMFLKEIKKSSLDAFENQDYPYEELVKEVASTRDASRNPLFDTMFVMQNMGIPWLERPGLKLTLYEYPTETSKFDLALIGWEAEEKLLFLFVYSTRLFKKDTIERFVANFKKVVSSVAANPDVKIGDVEILTQKEKKEILYDFNNTGVKYPKDKTIHRLFEEQVEKKPDHTALKGQIPNSKSQIPNKEDACGGNILITYKELNNKSSQLARLLGKKGVTRETITAIMMDPSLEMMIGILAVLKAGGAYLPIDPQQQAGRVTYMLKDSQVVLLLIQRHLANSAGFSVPSLAIDRDAVYKGGGNNLERKSNPADVVYTIYTSGTTGKSKGTLIENKNLVNYVNWFKEKVHLTERDRTVLTSSFSFDLGYTAIFPSILTGCQLHIIPRETYLSPQDLISYINQHGISYIKVTPSLFTTIVENSRFSQTACHMLRLVVLGGEEIKLRDVEKAHRIAGQLYFMNHYGPTEATIGCVAQFIDFDRFADYKKRPTIGAPIDNMKTVILDNGLMLLPVGVAGELCVSGASVARGYLNQPELTAQKFLPVSYMSYMSYMSYIYRTGDKARWLTGGMIEFLGRIDTQVKIRGYRIELGEIENQLLTHEDINEAVIIPCEHPSGDKYLCAYIVLKKPGSLNILALKEYLAVELPDYMIPSLFVELERIPLTPNGKLNRKLLPEPEIGVLTAHFEAPRNPLEKRLAEVWQEILEVDRIGIDDHFFQLGGHSLKAIILISRMSKVFHVNVPLVEIFRTPTIRGLSAYIKSKKEGLFTPIKPVEERDYHTLSSVQKRLYILHQMDEDSTSYNMPYALRLEGEVNKNELETIFLRLVTRHESLRTSFRMLAGEPVQQIHDNVEFEIEYKEVEEERSRVNWKSLKGTRGLAPLPMEVVERKVQSAEHLAPGARRCADTTENFIQPFDLSRAPLLRVRLIKESDQKYILMMDMHHIISDGISRRLLVKEFMALTAGKNLPPLRLQYKDFSQWQNQEAQREAQIKQKAYWKKQLQGEIPVLDLPCDYARPTIQRFEGSTIAFEIDQEEVRALHSLALAEGMTLYMILLAIYYILLSKLSNQEDILLGTPTVGRRHADLEQIIGMFVNTLVLRNYPSGDKTYRGFLKEIKKRSLQAFENQDYPYEELVEEVAITRDASRNPLFDTMFVVQNMETPKLEIPGLKLTLYEHPFETSKFDLTLIGWEAEEKLLFTFEYSTGLFKKEAIERFVTYLKKVVSSVTVNPDIKICDVEILGEEEKREILYDFNNATADCPKNKDIPKLFEEQAVKNPDSIAVIGTVESATGDRKLRVGGYEVSYKELNEKSNQLAYGLRSKGVTFDTIVGIMAERSLEMIIGILGILKSGGAYLPIDLEYPHDRILYMLKDSGANLLVTTGKLAKKDKTLGSLQVKKYIQVILIDSFECSNFSSSYLLNSSTFRPSRLAYVIYTSGTTGRSKGILTTHTNVIRVVKNTNYINLTPQDRVLQLSNYAFDGSMFDIYGALLNGAGLVMIRKESILSVDELSQVITRKLITVFFVTTALFNALIDLDIRCLSQIRKVLFGGERISVEHSKKALEHLNKDKIIHVYGPTETTVYATYYPINRIDKTRDTIPIGSPISNTTTYIVDKYDQPVPIGVPGELLIGGDGIARGYLNKPQLTAEKFKRAVISHSSLVTGSSKSFTNDQCPMTNDRSQKFFTNDRSQKFLSNDQCPMTNDRLYRSGDMVRWLGDGSIEFIGRVDLQVKIRGFRIELGEIENYLLKHSDIKEAIVITLQDENEDKYLCAYIVSDGERELSISQLRNYLSKNLPGYMLPSYFVLLETLPLTPNGKVDQKKLPKPDKKELTGIYIAPKNLVEKKLAEIWSGVLDIKKDVISTESNFFQLGGHSLKATILAFKIHQALNVKVPLAQLFKNPTIRELGEYLKALTEEKFITIKPVEEKEYYQLSSAQKRLYFIREIQLDNTAYNIPMLSVLEGKWERKRLEETFTELIHRHKSFRTSFEMIDEKPVQRIHDDVEFVIEYDQSLVNGHWSLVNSQGRDVPGGAPTNVPSPIKIEKITRNFIRPFDLSQAPLFRVRLIKLLHTPSALRGHPFPEGQEGKYLLMVDMHHIITDGTSMYLAIKDFIALYEGVELEPLKIQYKDYSEWQNSEMQQQAIRNQKEYWLKQFETGIPVLHLPLDYPRPSVQSFEGNTLGFELSTQLTHSLKHLAAENEATLFMVLLAIYNILLSKLSGQEDIVVGTSTAGRRHADLEHITGMLVNNLALRNFPGPGKTFKTFLIEVKERTLEAFENQDFQFEDLVECVVDNHNRDTSRNPLFDTLLSLQNIAADPAETSPGEIAGLRIKPYEIEHPTAKFDIQLTCIEGKDKICCAYEYCTKLFKKDTIQQFIIYFKKLVLDIIENPEKKISEIEIISEEEKEQLLERVDSTNLGYQGERLLLTSKFIEQRAYWLKRLSPGIEKIEPFLKRKIENETASHDAAPSPGNNEIKKISVPSVTSVAKINFTAAEQLGSVQILIPGQLFNRLVKLGKQSHLSLYLILLAALKVLIYRYTNHEDVIVISPVYKGNVSKETLNRRLFIRDRIAEEFTFADLLLEIRKSALEAYENQDYPSSKLIEYLQGTLGLKTDTAIADITCLLSNIHDTQGFDRPGTGLIFSFRQEQSQLKGHILYDRALYENGYIQLISKHLVNILDNTTKDIKTKILGISFLSKEEEKRYIIDFNRTEAQYPEEKTLVELFQEQVERTPQQIALVAQSENKKHSALGAGRSALTYREFNEKSNQLAHRLRAKGVKADTIVGIMAERSLPMLIGIMAILKAGGAFLPIDIEYPGPRQKFILEDSGAQVLLTQAHLLEKNKENMRTYPCRDIVSIDPDEQELPSGRYDNPGIIHHPLNLAYVIYTSGTSGKPKGVMVPHRALVNYTWWAAQNYVKEEIVHFPLYTSISFDLTMTSIFTPLITGNAIVIYPEEEEPMLIGQVIADDTVGVIKCTPSHLKLITYTGEEISSRNIKRFVVGGEKLERDLALEIHKKFKGNIEIYNEYGPTETTVGCMIYKFDPQYPGTGSVPIGKPINNTQVYILDRHLCPVPIGVPGELCISGDGVARGYLKREQITLEKFIQHPFIKVKDKRLYRSGDLARRLPDGNIQCLGRIDNQVKIRGFRIEMEEIAEHLLKYPSVKEAVVVAKSEKSGDHFLCAYIIPDNRTALEIPGLREYLSEVLPIHMVPDYFVLIDKIPLTVNGKVDSRALPEPDLQSGFKYVAPRTLLEKKLVGIWWEVLGVEKDIIGIDTNFFALGGHSLKATMAAARIHKEFNTKVQLADIFEKTTIRKLAKYISEIRKDKYIPIEPIHKKEYYALSSAQKRLFVIQQMDLKSTAYNVTMAMTLKGRLDKTKLEKTCAQLIAQHESLRTSFTIVENEAVQKIHPSHDISFKIEFYHLARIKSRVRDEEQDTDTIINYFIRPFNLSRAPLLRMLLIKIDSGDFIMLGDVHHIIADGISMEILMRDFFDLYRGNKLPPLKLQYKDYSTWQHQFFASGEIKPQEDFWLKQFEGDIPVINLPTDYERPDLQSFEGEIIFFTLEKELSDRLKQLIKDKQSTLHILIMVVYSILLSKYTDMEDIIVGSSISGRKQVDLENIIGMFVNMLALRVYPQGNKTFNQFLDEIKITTLKAYENQDYQFEELVRKLELQGSANRNPLFDVAFQDQNINSPQSGENYSKLGNVELTPYELKRRKTHFDLLLQSFETPDTIQFSLTYATVLFKKSTAEKMIKHFVEILEQILDDEHIKLEDITISHGVLTLKSNIFQEDQNDFNF